MLKNKFTYLIVGFLLLFLSVFLYQYFTAEAEAAPMIDAPEPELRKYWEKQIKKNPPEEVYATFVASYTSQDENRWHAAMHILASIMYEKYGVDALKYCDDSFQQACFHELMSSYAYEGIAVEPKEIDALCKRGWSCLHGIGHGLVMYHGYDKAALDTALSKCPVLPKNDFVDGCHSGAFMEFITRTMGKSRLEMQKIAEKADKGLCFEVVPEYKAGCHFVMIELLVAEVESIDTEVADVIHTYCTTTAVGYEDACFKGAGFNIKFLVEGVDEGIALCQKIGGGNPAHSDSCLLTLATQYLLFSKQEDSKLVCDSVTPELRAKCIAGV